MNEPKFCKDCKHYSAISIPGNLVIPKKCLKTASPNLVDGRLGYSDCSFVRYSIGIDKCGPDAKWFEPKL